MPKITPDTIMAVQWPYPAIRSRRNFRNTSSSIMGAVMTAVTRTVQVSMDITSSCMSLIIGSPFINPANPIRTVPMILPAYRTPMEKTKKPASFPIPHRSVPGYPVPGTHFIIRAVRGTATGYMASMEMSIYRFSFSSHTSPVHARTKAASHWDPADTARKITYTKPMREKHLLVSRASFFSYSGSGPQPGPVLYPLLYSMLFL